MYNFSIVVDNLDIDDKNEIWENFLGIPHKQYLGNKIITNSGKTLLQLQPDVKDLIRNENDAKQFFFNKYLRDIGIDNEFDPSSYHTYYKIPDYINTLEDKYGENVAYKLQDLQSPSDQLFYDMNNKGYTFGRHMYNTALERLLRGENFYNDRNYGIDKNIDSTVKTLLGSELKGQFQKTLGSGATREHMRNLLDSIKHIIKAPNNQILSEYSLEKAIADAQVLHNLGKENLHEPIAYGYSDLFQSADPTDYGIIRANVKVDDPSLLHKTLGDSWFNLSSNGNVTRSDNVSRPNYNETQYAGPLDANNVVSLSVPQNHIDYLRNNGLIRENNGNEYLNLTNTYDDSKNLLMNQIPLDQETAPYRETFNIDMPLQYEGIRAPASLGKLAGTLKHIKL